ncbi:unnamed protein product [Mytilus edulis]|uniref:C-type lectin domain-containing protein n=1 Tax=Mytilus edulis TaxID=6550 RepID=A0A8S3PMW4_MYTED|nr:unnamed protein product [Mytilus edulis]
MDLAIIESSTELTRVQECVVANGGFIGDAWIGGYYDENISEHRWVDSTLFDWTNWEASEPNCLDGTCLIDEHCVRLDTAYEFRTRACTVPFDVLCEKERSTTFCHHWPCRWIWGFIALVTLCCITWNLFCGNSDDDKISPEPVGVVNISKNSTQDIAKENPWLKDEEISFCLRDKYTFELSQELTGKRTKYIK